MDQTFHRKPLKIVGTPGSPYSRKLRAVLRYRRIPHQWILKSSSDDQGIPDAPTPIIPVLVLPGAGAGDEAMVDSTFQIQRLDEAFEGREVIPRDPAVAFLDFLIEDFGDEWLTKAMYHYRWSFDVSAQQAKVLLPSWVAPGASRQMSEPVGDFLRTRQVARLGLVGISETTAPLVEESYRELLGCLDAHLTNRRFIWGERPGRSDFGLFGQLSQLVLIDPVSVELARDMAPRIIGWCEFVEDLSGIRVAEDGWVQEGDPPATLRALLAIVGKYYAPFLRGNAEAVASGASSFECTIAGRSWVQRPFGYQAKCFRWLRDAYGALPRVSREQVDRALDGTGCEALFVEP